MIKSTMLIVAAGTLALAGCNGPSNGSASANASAAAGSQAGGTDQAKLSAYTGSYNKLLDTFGLPETQESYFEQDIAAKSPSDSISVNDGWIEAALTDLRKAQAMPGGPADVNAAAGELAGALDTVLKRLGGLKVYYDSKAYRDDGLRRGKAEDGAMRAEFTAATAALGRFDRLLDRERKAATGAELAALKAAGQMLGYNTKLALTQAEAVVDLFAKPDDIRNPAVFARGDAQIAVLEKTLADQRIEIAKAPGTDPVTRSSAISYKIVADQLTSFIGDYRDLKQSRDADAYNAIVKSYNRAIETSNDID